MARISSSRDGIRRAGGCTTTAAVEPGSVLRAAVILGLLAWGTLSPGGGVYPSEYAPLAVGCALVGLWGLVGRAERGAGVHKGLLAALFALVAAVGLQLVPLPLALLNRFSPMTSATLQRYSVTYAAAVRDPDVRVWHPLSLDPALTHSGLVLLVAFALLLLGAVRALTRRDIRIIAYGLVGLGVIMALAGIVTRGLGFHQIYGIWKTQEGGYPFGPFVNHDHFAGWMLMAIPVGMGVFAGLVERGMEGAGRGRRGKLLWFASPEASRAVLVAVALFVMAISLVMTFSRAGIGCLIGAVVLSGAVAVRHRALGARRVVFVAYLATLVILAVGWVGVDAVASKFASAADPGLDGRLGAWSDAISIAERFPMTGTGLNTYGVATLFYQQHDLAQHYDQAHNDYLQIAAEGGLLLIVPVAILLLVFAAGVRQAFHRSPRDGRTYWIKVGAVTGLLAIAMQEVVDFSLQMPGNAVLFAVLCAIALAVTDKVPEKQGYGDQVIRS